MTTHFDAVCWSCGYRMDSHSAVGTEDAVPSAGDLSVCLACGELAIYQPVLGALTLRAPTPAEREEALSSATIVNVMLAHRQARAADPQWPTGAKP